MDRIDFLFQEWNKLGGQVLLSQVDDKISVRPVEQIIAESTAYCRESSRLTWVVLSWLVRHIEQVNPDVLLQQTRRMGDLSVLGVLCDAAREKNPHPKFEVIIRGCQKPKRVEPFFRRVGRSQLALKLTQENALDVFKRWNYLSSELSYL